MSVVSNWKLQYVPMVVTVPLRKKEDFAVNLSVGLLLWREQYPFPLIDFFLFEQNNQQEVSQL